VVAVSIDNFSIGAIPEVKDLTQATFNLHYIRFLSNEMVLSKKQQLLLSTSSHCLIKYDSAANPDYQFNSDTAHYNSIILNEDPKFLNEVRKQIQY
jgi:hypothetical protein